MEEVHDSGGEAWRDERSEESGPFSVAKLDFSSVRLTATSARSLHSMSSVIAPSSLCGAGGGDNTLVVGASDGFRLFSHGTRWHPWAFVGVNQHPAWKLPPPPRSADEPEDTVDTEADVLMTSFAPISVEGSGRLLLCTGNTHGWIHLFDLSTIRKPRRWEDEMTNSGVDSISGKAVLADVSKDLTCLLRWQAYTDAPVAGLKMMRQCRNAHRASWSHSVFPAR